MWIVLFGNLCDGYRFVGPFGSSEQASNFVRHLPPAFQEGHMILDLIHPDLARESAKKFTRKNAQ